MDIDARFLVAVDRRRWWLAAGMACLYAAGFNGLWRIGEDSAVHVAIARSLAEGGGLVHPTGREIEVSPGLSCLLGGVFKLLGSGDAGMVGAHVMMLALAGVCLGLVYVTFREQAGRPVAVLVTAMTAVTETFFRYAFALLTDLPFAAGMWAMLAGLELLRTSGRHEGRRGGRGVAGAVLVAGGLAAMALMRSVFVTVCVAVVVAGLWQGLGWWGPGRGGVRGGVGGGGGGVRGWGGGGGGGYDQFTLGHALLDQPVQTLRKALTAHLPKLLTESVAEGLLGFDPGSVVGLPLSVYILAGGLLLARVRPLWGVLVAVFAVQWVVFGVTDRYMVPLLPLLCYGWWRSACWLAGRWPHARAQRAVLGVLAVLFVAPNLVKCGALILEQRHGDFYARYKDGQMLPYLAAAGWLASSTPPQTQVVMNDAYSAELTAWSSRTAWPFRAALQRDVLVPPMMVLEPIEPRALRQLQRKGWRAGEVAWSYTDRDGTTWTLRGLTPQP